MMPPTDNPFPGLRSFDYKESHLFFGREKNIADLLRKLNSNRFVAIMGTSGSGKSSLVRAGLLPAVHQGRLGADGTRWLTATMKPGNTPVKNLARALLGSDAFGTGDAEVDDARHRNLESVLRASRLGLVQAVREMLVPDSTLILLLDQFEETFRFSGEGMERNDEDSTLFVNSIIDAVRQRDVPIYIVLTIRSDFLGDCARFEGLPEAINDGQYLVPRLTREQNRSVITDPVSYAKGKISPRLVHRVIEEIGDNPDQLPVLQHALMRTWDVWVSTAAAGEPMDIRHYDLIGGMDRALSNHADEAFNELGGESQKKLFETILKCLTVKTGDSRGVRRPTSIANLMKITGASFTEVLEALHPFRMTGRTFILPAEDQVVTECTVMDISHESLMRAWQRLGRWVDEESESAALYVRLCESAELRKEGKAALWRNPELQTALEWRARAAPNEAWSRQYNEQFSDAIGFLEDSRKDDEAEKARSKARRRVLRVAAVTFIILITALSGWALLQTKEAQTQSALADKNRIEAERKAQEAINQKQLAEKAEEMALEASKRALDAKSYAELQSKVASEQTRMAEKQKRMAEEQKTKAELEARRATQQQQIAVLEKQKADSSQAEAYRLRMLSMSQNVAFKALQEKGTRELAALLARQAYTLAAKNGGSTNDAQLYAALFTTACNLNTPYKPIAFRESDVIVALSLSEKTLISLTRSGTVKNRSTDGYGVVAQQSLRGLPAPQNTSYISDDGRFAALGLDNNAIAVFDLRSSGVPAILSGHTGLVRAVAFSGDGGTLATGGRDSTVMIWNGRTLIQKVRCASRVRAITFNGDADIIAGGEDGTVVTMRKDGSEVRALVRGSGRVQAIEGGSALTGIAYSSGMVQLVNGRGDVVRTFTEPAGVDALALDERNGILVAGLSNGLLHIYRLSESGKPTEIRCDSPINTLVARGDFIYVACADQTIRAYPVNTSFLEQLISRNLKRGLSKEEWDTYIGKEVAYDTR
jgi:hypothetical protein